MNHIAEQIIEAYVRHPEDLDAATIQSAATHLESCGACRSIAGYLRTFYAELDSQDKAVSPQVEDWMATHFPGARIIPLYPFQPEPDKVYASNEYTVVLAAMTHEPPAPRFQAVATLASAQKDTLLRIIRDNTTNTFRLYILAEDRRKREHAIISFPELALNFVADERGQVTFALAESAIPVDWEALQSVLRLPICAFRLRAEQLQQASEQNPLIVEESAAPDHEIKLSHTGDTLALAVRPRRVEAPTSTLAVVGGTASHSSVVALQAGKGLCKLSALPEELTIRLYC